MKRFAIVSFALLFTLAAAQDMPSRPKQLENLDFLAGKWAAAADKENNTTMVINWALGKRYMKFEQSGKLMGVDSEGLMMLTFDETKNKYSSTWFDSWSGHPMTGTGDWKGNVLTTITESVEMMGQKTNIRMTLTKKSNDAFDMDVASGEGDKWETMIQFKYVRAK